MLNAQGYKHTLRICNTFAIPLQHWLQEKTSKVTLHVHCVSCLNYVAWMIEECVCVWVGGDIDGVILTGPQLEYQEKSLPLSLCPPQASDTLGFRLNPAIRTDSPMTNRPSRGKARRFYWVIKRNWWTLLQIYVTKILSVVRKIKVKVSRETTSFGLNRMLVRTLCSI